MRSENDTAEFAVEAHARTASECVVRVQGALDWHTHPHLESALAPFLVASGPQRLVLDLSEVSYLDSSGLATLVRARGALWERGGRMVLQDCQPAVRYALDRTRLARLFDMVSG
jgi:anti-anti-sigma factor